MKPDERWKKIRSKGSFHFTLTRGLFGGGCLLFINGFLSRQMIHSQPILTIDTFWSAIGSLAVGFLLAGVIWSINESRYNGPRT